MNYLTAVQALDLIKNHPEEYLTIESLKNLLKQVDMSNPGKITLLYSGQYGDIKAQDIVITMASNGDDIRIIDDTQVAKLLITDELRDTVGRVFGITDAFELEIAFKDRSSP